jgi:glycosyltransferase involved in cell wall biosynthesis
MRILIVHSRYLSEAASGENVVVEDEAKLLTRGGHHVEVWQPRPTRVTGMGLVRTGMQATWSREGVARVRRMIRHMEAEIVHFHNLFPTLSPAVLRAATEEGAAAVMTLHNYRLMCLPSTFLRDGRICEDCIARTPWPGIVHRCYRDSLPGSAALAASLSLHKMLRTFDRVALYLPVSEFVRNKYIEAGFAAERLRVKSNFAWATTRREGPGDHFVYLGRLSAEKGVRTLVSAWKHMSAKLVIVGDGPEGGRLRDVAPKTIEFTGLVHHAEVADLLRGARALLVPSLWYEAQPRVILEAYATGVPVIASRIGGLPDFVIDRETGFLVSPQDHGAWARAAGWLLDDSEAERLGEGAYRLWKDRYSPERGLEDLTEAYRFARSRPPSP